MTTIPGYYIIDDWVSRADLYINGTNVKFFPTQSDMNYGRRWIRPGNEADIIHPAKFIDTPTGQRYGLGGLVFIWPMMNLSPKMAGYIQVTYFSPSSTPANFFYRTWSNKLTVQTFNRGSGEWETYQVYGRYSNLGDEAEPALGGYNNLKITFTAFKVAPLGPDLQAASVYP